MSFKIVLLLNLFLFSCAGLKTVSKKDTPINIGENTEVHNEPSIEEVNTTTTNPEDYWSQDQALNWIVNVYQKISHSDVAIISNTHVSVEEFENEKILKQDLVQSITSNDPLMGADISLDDLKAALCNPPKKDKLYSDLIVTGLTLLENEHQKCIVKDLQKQQVKVVIPKSVLTNSEFFTKDFAKKFFKFGVTNDESISRYMNKYGFN